MGSISSTNLTISTQDLSVILPMHIVFGTKGEIRSIGKTLDKIARAEGAKPRTVFDILQFRRPRLANKVNQLIQHAGKPLTLALVKNKSIILKGAMVSLSGQDEMLLNVSLGFSMATVVSTFGLTLHDFAPTDATVEMLYLIEAKSHAWNLSKSLSERLETARGIAEEQAFTDMLTGLKNRRALDQTLEGLVDGNFCEKFGLMHVDLDYFKQVNDTQGHAAGDAVLQRVAEVLTRETRKEDLVARVGGDEFVLLIRNCNDLPLMDSIAKRVIAELEVPIPFEGQTCRISASIGTTISGYYTKLDSDRMLSDADQALYASKHKGRAQHTIFSPNDTDWMPSPGAEVASITRH